MKRKVLIVEDNADLASLVALHLADIDCDADIAPDGGIALELFQKQSYDLILLDIMLPVMDGITLCRKFRESGHYVPIIMLTSKSSEIDRVVGLEMGADDYLTKPFSMPELQARIKARFRAAEALNKTTSAAESTDIHIGDLEINVKKRLVTIDKSEISLTAREFELLLFFARHPGQVFSRNQLLDQVWGYQFEGYEHTVNTHINRLA